MALLVTPSVNNHPKRPVCTVECTGCLDQITVRGFPVMFVRSLVEDMDHSCVN